MDVVLLRISRVGALLYCAMLFFSISFLIAYAVMT